MIAYSTLGTNDMDRSIAFYDAVFGALGAVREVTSSTWTRYGRPGERAKVCLTIPFDQRSASGGNGTMLAFEAHDYAAVDAFHAAALALGGTDEGLPAFAKAPTTSPMRVTLTATSSVRSRRNRRWHLRASETKKPGSAGLCRRPGLLAQMPRPLNFSLKRLTRPPRSIRLPCTPVQAG